MPRVSEPTLAARPQAPRAGGRPIREAVADQAAEWLTLLMSGEATPQDQARWQQWRAVDPEHERAWQHIESVTQQFRSLPAGPAYQALSPRPARRAGGRRNALAALFGVGVLGGGTLLARRTATFQQLAADHRTGTGERREIDLPDGTRLTLNSGSAVDLRFDAQRRVLRLLAGEIEVRTGHPDGAGPFFVETAQGTVQALGTRFTVRQHEGHSQVAVLESAVAIRPAQGQAPALRLQAGEQTAFDAASVQPPRPLDEQATAWLRGLIVADEQRLDEFLAELSRHRPGLLRCDPAVAGLRLSGVFPLANTDRVLAALPSVLPVQVTQRTRYWVTVAPA